MSLPQAARRLLVGATLALASLAATAFTSGDVAGADTPLVPTTFTLTVSGTRMTATLTAQDGSVPAGLPIEFSFQPAGAGVTTVNSGATLDGNGLYSLDDGYPDFGTTYWFSTPGDTTYAPSTTNTVHFSAPVTTTLYVLSNLSGATVSGFLASLHGYRKPGMTVDLYGTANGVTTLVASPVTDSVGGWSVSLPTITTPTMFQAVVVSDVEDTGSASTTGGAAISTKTTIATASSGGNVTVRGSVRNGTGAGEAGVHVHVLGRTGRSRMKVLGSTTTDRYGHYRYTHTACTAACWYEAVALQDDSRVTSWVLTGAVKAPSRLELTAHRGRPDHLTAILTRAANSSPIANQKITVYYRYAGTTKWIRQTVGTTNRYGKVVVREQPKRRCYFTARYAGSTTIARAASTKVLLR